MQIEQKNIISQAILLFPTWGDFITKCPPENLIVQYNKTTLLYHSIDKKRLSLEDISSIYLQTDGVPSGLVYVIKWLNHLNEFSNINKCLPVSQVENVSKLIYTKYSHFYLSDFKLILEWILEGRYGKFYGSVDSQLILSAFFEYNQDRQKLIDNLLKQNEKEIDKKPDKAITFDNVRKLHNLPHLEKIQSDQEIKEKFNFK